MPKYTAVGEYTVYYKVTKDGYEPKTGSAKIIIKKATGSLVLNTTEGETSYPTTITTTVKTNTAGAITWSSSDNSIATATVASNGTITFTPGTKAGIATITFTAAATSTHTAATATFTIEVSNGTLTVNKHPYSGVYDTKPHSATVSCSTSGVTITYSESEGGTYSATAPTKTDAGTYRIYYKVSKDGYGTATGYTTITITRSPTATVSGDGSVHNFTGSDIIGITGTNVDFIDGSTVAKNAGTYTVKVKPSANYEWVGGGTEEKTVTWTINNPMVKKGDMIITKGGVTGGYTNAYDACKKTNLEITYSKNNERYVIYMYSISIGDYLDEYDRSTADPNKVAIAISGQYGPESVGYWVRIDEVDYP
jgi:hypothetical protein